MKRVFLLGLLLGSLLLVHTSARADETVTVTATNSDISEDLDLRMVATLFGQAKDLEEFEQMLNNPDSAFSNLDLNGDGDVDYLRVVETADESRHLVVIQAVLAKDIYQDVASIFVEKDPESESVTVQVIGDEYIYGANYIIEPVYIYRPYIYDWFWGPSWIAWHSPYYWGYWPGWWHPYHCIAHHLYWDHMYWHHHYHPICAYRTGHHYHPHYAPMRNTVSRADYASRHPERSFATRNASRRVTNARDFDRNRSATVRSAASRGPQADATRAGQTRISSRSTSSRNSTFESSNLRNSTSSRATTTSTRGNAAAATSTVSRGGSVTATTTRSAATASSRTVSGTTSRPSASSSSSGSSSSMRSGSSSSMRSGSSSSMRSSSSSAVRSSGGSSMRSSGMSGGGAMRSSGGSSSSRGGGGGTRR